MTNVDHALAMIHDGFVVGLGTGRAATAFIRALGLRVRGGLRLHGVPTSEATAVLAREVGIPLIGLDEVESLNLTVDGADEVDPQLNLIKGLGGALVREKVVAAAAKRLVILVGADKMVSVLGARKDGKQSLLPVEVVPFAHPFCRRRFRDLGFDVDPRPGPGGLFMSDNGNHILDLRISPIKDPAALDAALLGVPGVVGTGLFLNMAHTVLVQDGDRVEVLSRRNP